MMKTNVGIIGYGMGNIMSLFNAFRAVGVDVFVTEHPSELERASHLVLPGVGAFSKGMEQLRSLGFDSELRRLVFRQRRPLLGVCLGMQLLASTGEEHGNSEGLSLIAGRVIRLDVGSLRIPHIGWNDTVASRDSILLGKCGTTACFYYVHSYHFVPEDEADATMFCSYGPKFSAAVERGNIFGVQFHPEKSHEEGLCVLKRFTEVGSGQAPSDSLSLSAERVDCSQSGI